MIERLPVVASRSAWMQRIALPVSAEMTAVASDSESGEIDGYPRVHSRPQSRLNPDAQTPPSVRL